jgi:DNA-binding response OmpR family regulator
VKYNTLAALFSATGSAQILALSVAIMYVDSEALWRGIRMRRRILLVDDEVAVLLTLKAVLEISGYEVDTAASAREGVSKLHTREYQMLITDMRMEHDVAGIEVIRAARAAAYHPVVALLTAYPVSDEDWQEMGADQLLVKPMHTRILLRQIEDMIATHERNLPEQGIAVNSSAPEQPAKKAKVAGKKGAPKKKAVSRKVPARKSKSPMPPQKVAAIRTQTRATKSVAKPEARARTSAAKTAKTSTKRGS